MSRTLTIYTVLFLLAALGCAQVSLQPGGIQRISAERLRDMLGRSDVIVVDVRSPSDWNGSRSKISGAVWENPYHLSAEINRFPRQKTLVFYCA